MKKMAFGLSAVLLAGIASAAWTVDTASKTLTDGVNWKFTYKLLDAKKPLELCLTKAEKVDGSSDCSTLDLTSFSADTEGYIVMGIDGTIFDTGKMASELVTATLPDLVYLKQQGDWGESGVFYNCVNLTTVTISPDVYVLRNGAFRGCAKLVNLSPTTFPKVVDQFGMNAFYGCSSLVGPLSFPNATQIPAGAFRECGSLTDFDVPLATSIGNYAFVNCTNLVTKKSFPEVTTYNGDGNTSAFKNCPFEELEFPKLSSFNSWGGLGYMPKLKKITFGADYLTSMGSFDGDAELVEILPDVLPNVTSISGTFSGLKKITQVPEMPNLQKIAAKTFNNASALISFTAGGKVTEVGESAFNSCTSLVSVEGVFGDQFNFTTNKFGIVDAKNAFYNCSALEAEVVFGPQVKEIPSSAFWNCQKITALTAPGVTNINASAFSSCLALTNVVLCADVEILNNSAFEKCASLTSFAPTCLPKVHAVLGSKVFNGCTALTGDWSFPNYTNALEQYLFDATKIGSVQFPQVKNVKDRFVYTCAVLTNCWVGGIPPAGFQGAYLVGLTNYAGNAQQFNSCKSLTNLYVDCPAIAITLGSNAWTQMNGLTNAVFKSVVNFNGQNAFRDFAKGATVEFWSEAYPTFSGNDCFGRWSDITPSFPRIVVRNAAALDAWTSHAVDLEAQLTTWNMTTDAKKKPYYDDMPAKVLGLIRPVTAGSANSGWCWLVDGTPPAGTLLSIL